MKDHMRHLFDPQLSLINVNLHSLVRKKFAITYYATKTILEKVPVRTISIDLKALRVQTLGED